MRKPVVATRRARSDACRTLHGARPGSSAGLTLVELLFAFLVGTLALALALDALSHMYRVGHVRTLRVQEISQGLRLMERIGHDFDRGVSPVSQAPVVLVERESLPFTIRTSGGDRAVVYDFDPLTGSLERTDPDGARLLNDEPLDGVLFSRIPLPVAPGTTIDVVTATLASDRLAGTPASVPRPDRPVVYWTARVLRSSPQGIVPEGWLEPDGP